MRAIVPSSSIRSRQLKVGDTVSYRVTSLGDFSFAGTLVEVHDDHVIIAGDPNHPDTRYRGTREDRPVVDGAEVD